MHVALAITFHASRKEPLAALLERIHAGFLASGLGEPAMQFCFSDAPLPGFTSSVDRVLKRHHELQRLVWTGSVLPGIPPIRQISNGPGSPAPGEAVPFATLLTIAAGVPRSFPFHNISLHFHAPAFGAAPPGAGPLTAMPLGVTVGDSWWVNGRLRSVYALTSVEAIPGSTKLPPPPDTVAAVLAACGKVKSTRQVPLADTPETSPAPQAATASPDVARAVTSVVRDYRARFAEVMDQAALPHDLPPARDALMTVGFGEATGPKKPVLVRAFKPLGYDCRGGSGTFTLRRRTSGNLTVEISLDVGTWSRSLTASFRVTGLGFSAVLPLPVSRHQTGGGQYRIGDAAHWQKLVDNLAALVAELDRSLVPAVEAAAGPSPDWYSPES